MDSDDTDNWVFEVATAEGGWTPARPSGAGWPYRYKEAEEAKKAARMCYPDQVRMDRLDHAAKRVRIRHLKTDETQPCF